MRTHMECRSLGESKSNYTTNSSVRQIKQKDTTAKKSSSGGGKLAVGLLAGAAAGAIAGVLLAPDKGKNTRKKVSDTANKWGGQVNKGYSSTKDKMSTWTNKLKSGKTDAHVNEAPDLPHAEKQKSPYTDPGKWDDQENKNMTNTVRNTPGL